MPGSKVEVRPPGPTAGGAAFGTGCSGAGVVRITPETMHFNAVEPRCAMALNSLQLRRAGPCHSAVVYSHATQFVRCRHCDWQAAVEPICASSASEVPDIWSPGSLVDERCGAGGLGGSGAGGGVTAAFSISASLILASSANVPCG